MITSTMGRKRHKWQGFNIGTQAGLQRAPYHLWDIKGLSPSRLARKQCASGKILQEGPGELQTGKERTGRDERRESEERRNMLPLRVALGSVVHTQYLPQIHSSIHPSLLPDSCRYDLSSQQPYTCIQSKLCWATCWALPRGSISAPDG